MLDLEPENVRHDAPNLGRTCAVHPCYARPVRLPVCSIKVPSFVLTDLLHATVPLVHQPCAFRGDVRRLVPRGAEFGACLWLVSLRRSIRRNGELRLPGNDFLPASNLAHIFPPHGLGQLHGAFRIAGGLFKHISWTIRPGEFVQDLFDEVTGYFTKNKVSGGAYPLFVTKDIKAHYHCDPSTEVLEMWFGEWNNRVHEFPSNVNKCSHFWTFS